MCATNDITYNEQHGRNNGRYTENINFLKKESRVRQEIEKHEN